MRTTLWLLLLPFLLLPLAGARQDESPLVGTWIGADDPSTGDPGTRVVLAADGSGELGGVALRWKAWGKNRLRLTVEGETVRATYVLDEPILLVTLEGTEYRYTREGAAPAKPRVEGYQVPPALEGAGAGATTPYAHPKGYFRCALPVGWTVAGEVEEALLVNPGLGEGDSLDALILLTWGELDEDERGAKPAALVDGAEAEFRASMREQGIVLEAAAKKAVPVLVGDVPGATQEWTGRTSAGQAVRLWLGGIVKREYHLSVAVVMLDGKAERFLPGVKQVFASLQATPPERNTAAEAALADRTMSRSKSQSSGYFGSIYQFHADGSVKKELLMSGMSGMSDISGSSEEWGRFEVVGDVLYLYFQDGQDAGTLVVEQGQLVGVQFGDELYRLR